MSAEGEKKCNQKKRNRLGLPKQRQEREQE